MLLGKHLLKFMKIFMILFMVLAIFANLDSIFYGWNNHGIGESKVTGNAIIVILYRYQKQHGEFPSSLDDLIPEYYHSIPQPIAGEGRWIYAISEHETLFILSFAMPHNFLWSGYPSYNYNSSENYWQVDE